MQRCHKNMEPEDVFGASMPFWTKERGFKATAGNVQQVDEKEQMC